MGLAIMIIGLAAFLGAHTLVALRPQRAAVIARVGEGPYKGLFALVSLVGIILIGYGFARYRAAGYIDVWMPPRWTRHVTEALVWPSIIFIVAAYVPSQIKRLLKQIEQLETTTSAHKAVARAAQEEVETLKNRVTDLEKSGQRKAETVQQEGQRAHSKQRAKACDVHARTRPVDCVGCIHGGIHVIEHGDLRLGHRRRRHPRGRRHPRRRPRRWPNSGPGRSWGRR